MAPFDDRQFLSELLRGAPVACLASARGDPRQFLTSCDYHGVTSLVQRQLARFEGESFCPQSIRRELKDSALLATAKEMICQRAITSLLNALGARDLPALLMKGTSLAYTLYSAPELRSRSDTDLLIQKQHLQAASEVFEGLGYQRANAVTGELISAQLTYAKPNDSGGALSFDLHWRISNFHLLAERLSFDELWQASTLIPILGPHARGLGSVHALLLACMHRLSHRQAPYYVDGLPRYDGDRLIWLYDIHLLCQALDAGQWEEFMAAAQHKGLEDVCLDGLAASTRFFGTTIPSTVLVALGAGRSSKTLSAAAFSLPRWRWELAELSALGDWQKRIQLIRERLFPSANYILRKYHTGRRGLLPFLYLRRSVSGLWKRL